MFLKKTKKGKLKRIELVSEAPRFGELGLKAFASGTLNTFQLKAAKKAIEIKIKRKGKVWTCVFPNLPITAKPMEFRMGKGKGPIVFSVVRVRKGTVIFEVCGVSNHLAKKSLKAGSKKLPVKTKIFD